MPYLLTFTYTFNYFTVEVVNDGAKGATGNYYSWDIRISSFVIGIIFLALYYKRYHVMRILTRFNICGCGITFCPIFMCCKKDDEMHAIPNVIELEEIKTSAEGSIKSPARNIDTQTSVIEVKKNGDIKVSLHRFY